MWPGPSGPGKQGIRYHAVLCHVASMWPGPSGPGKMSFSCLYDGGRLCFNVAGPLWARKDGIRAACSAIALWLQCGRAPLGPESGNLRSMRQRSWASMWPGPSGPGKRLRDYRHHRHVRASMWPGPSGPGKVYLGVGAGWQFYMLQCGRAPLGPESALHSATSAMASPLQCGRAPLGPERAPFSIRS